MTDKINTTRKVEDLSDWSPIAADYERMKYINDLLSTNGTFPVTLQEFKLKATDDGDDLVLSAFFTVSEDGPDHGKRLSVTDRQITGKGVKYDGTEYNCCENFASLLASFGVSVDQIRRMGGSTIDYQRVLSEYVGKIAYIHAAARAFRRRNGELGSASNVTSFRTPEDFAKAKESNQHRYAYNMAALQAAVVGGGSTTNGATRDPMAPNG